MDQKIFGAPIYAADGLMANQRFDICGDWPAQAPIADDHFGNALTDESGRNAPSRGFYFRKFRQRQPELFDLRLFVFHVLSDHGIEFLRLELVRMQALILGGRVVVTGAGGGNQLDFVAHERPLKP
jgi:hypothetical protein